MFAVESERFFLKIFSAWFLFSMLLVFSAGIQPVVLILPVVIAVLVLTYWSVDCAYRTERFSRYATFRLISNLALAPAIAFVMTLAVSHIELKLGPLASVALSSVPLIIAGAAYAVMYAWRSKHSSLHVRGQRVVVVESAQQHHWGVGAVGAGLGSLLYPVFEAHNTSYSVVVFISIVLSLFMVFYHRSSISALRGLKEKESRERCHYTFMNIEEIREKRAASLLGRIFAVRAGR
ncbi:hypothetical protein [Pseudomonas sp. GZD-222]|uniref:hypothetical protein n=1 Tax=Pseudomonas sp. GZD-222 TaxID=3404805 RepID=UPI003BB7E86F